MTTTSIHWSTDMTKAPRGENVPRIMQVMVKGEAKEQTRYDFVPTRILALTKCGKVVPTYWIPGKAGTLDGERWSGLNRGEQPLAWAAWPDADELTKQLNGEPPAVIIHKHVFLEDVGSGA